MITHAQLKDKTAEVLRFQGYDVNDGNFSLQSSDRNTKREAHILAKVERMLSHEKFVTRNVEFVKRFMVNGSELEIDKISPTIIEVKPESEMETLFRWWNLVWWSLPYERSYGRQMRFVIWDRHHKAPMGLIGLQSPLLNWGVRDEYLGLTSNERDFWVNQSLNAQRLGALPPYNNIFGGKLVASLMTTDYVRRKFKEKYRDTCTVLRERELPANLLFVTTTGAYGKSRVYSRLNIQDKPVAVFLGYTSGSGSFHIPNFLYEDFILFLKQKKYNVERGYGNGPSRKVRLIREAMRLLGFNDGINHNVQRSIYLFPFAENLKEIINEGKRPKWIKRSQKLVSDTWKERWAIPRSKIDTRYLDFCKDTFVENTTEELEAFRELFNKICPR